LIVTGMLAELFFLFMSSVQLSCDCFIIVASVVGKEQNSSWKRQKTTDEK
jgi:hypothetical protein